MLQETTIAPGGDAAAALSQMGVDHLINEMVTNPGQHIDQWVVALTLILMSVMSIYWIVVHLIKNINLLRRGDSVVATKQGLAQGGERVITYVYIPVAE